MVGFATDEPIPGDAEDFGELGEVVGAQPFGLALPVGDDTARGAELLGELLLGKAQASASGGDTRTEVGGLGDSDLKHKILAIVEEEGAERASYALKLLQLEGELSIASTGKDPVTGRMVAQEYRVEGLVMIFLTTTAADIDEELLNRCLVLSVDEGRAQTAALGAGQYAQGYMNAQ